MSSLKSGAKDILVATDVAGRGIDIKYVIIILYFSVLVCCCVLLICFIVSPGMCRLLSTMTWPSQLKVCGVADSLVDVVSCKAILKCALHLAIYSLKIF